jgi:hypothetical protein
VALGRNQKLLARRRGGAEKSKIGPISDSPTLRETLAAGIPSPEGERQQPGNSLPGNPSFLRGVPPLFLQNPPCMFTWLWL